MLLTAKATFIRNTISLFRAYPWTFFIGHIFSGVYAVLFGYFAYYYIFQGSLDSRFAVYAGSADYLSYVILGGAIYAFAVSTLMNVSRALITELREGTLEALLLTPSSRKGYFLGNVTQQTMRTLFEFVIILSFGWLFGLKLGGANFGGAVAVWLIMIGAFFCQALVLGSVMLRFRDTYISQNTLFVVMAFVSGVSFPVEYLPVWLQPLSLIMPLTPALEAFRMCVMEGKSMTELGPQLWHLAILSVIYLAIGSWSMRRMEKYAMENIFG